MTRETTEHWSRAMLEDVLVQPRTIGVDPGSWERTVEWAYDPKTSESWVIEDHGWKRIGQE